MECPKCKKENTSDAKFCNECGALLDGQQTPPAPVQVPSRKRYWYWAIVLALAIAYFVITVLKQPRETQVEPAADTTAVLQKKKPAASKPISTVKKAFMQFEKRLYAIEKTAAVDVEKFLSIKRRGDARDAQKAAERAGHVCGVVSKQYLELPSHG